MFLDNFGNNILDSVSNQGVEWKPFQKYTLFDFMKIYQSTSIHNLHFLFFSLCNRIDEMQIDNHIGEDYALNEKQIKAIQQILNSLERDLEYLNLEFSLKYVEHTRSLLSKTLRYDKYCDKIEELNLRIEDELKGITFGFVPNDLAVYLNNENIFGMQVAESFPSANKELTEAGNCFAHGLNTACVFHLMRAVEIALKVMYFDMTKRKTITVDAKRKKTKPIILCDWQKIIGALKAEYKKLDEKSSSSEKRKQKLIFYSEAINTFELFKNAWRNTISHGNDVAENRKTYLQGETEDIIKSTKHFMQHLAKRIKE